MGEGLSTHDLSKSYGTNRVVQNIYLTLRRGQVHAVVGENGAGKSTLMKMLAGIVSPTSGNILLDGEPISFRSPSDAARAGIAIVHQELQIVPELTVADNLMLVRPPKGRGLRRRSDAEKSFVGAALARVGLTRSPATPARSLSAAEAQLLEIAKALALDARYIIFDEPTSALPPSEADRLLTLIEGLRQSGIGILYISHHLSEVMRIADVVTVLRDGRAVGELARAEMQLEQIIHMMVDRPVSLYANDLTQPDNHIVFEAHKVSTARVANLDFTIRKGEILGFAGLIGSGMHNAAHALVGSEATTAGSIVVSGRKVRFRHPADAARSGVVFVPEERKLQGIFPELPVEDNLHIGRYAQFSNWGMLSLSKLKRRTNTLVRDFDIRLTSTSQPIATLSGGNQQKAVVARCVQSEPVLLVVAEPTRGVDIGAKDDIHKRIIALAAEGHAIVVVSSELDEVIALSHRVAVFAEGRMAGILDKKNATPQAVMTLATPTGRRALANELA
jgi:ribose transport system ATP-binding protein